MCFYDPPLLLGTPDLSAVLICSLPLAVSATNWRELLSAWVGLSVAFWGAHFFVVALADEWSSHATYDLASLMVALSIGAATVAFELVFFFTASQGVRRLWRGEYRRAIVWITPVVLVIGAVVGFVAYIELVLGAPEVQQSLLLAASVSAPGPSLTIANCNFPPLGDDMTGYIMLAALTLFEILVSVGIANAINRRMATTT